MNRGNMLQSLAMQQMLGGGPNNWWRIMPTPKPSTSPPPAASSQPPFFAASSQPHLFPNQLAPPWHHTQELPDSLSELLMVGSVSEEDKSALNFTDQQVKKLENWEEQLLHDNHNQDNSSNVANAMLESAVKQENSLNYGSSSYGDFHCLKPNDWSNPMIPVSSPNSCISSLSNNMLDFSSTITKTTNGRHPPPDRSSECKSSGGASKKAKIEPSSNKSTFKVRKEKLGDRITALHQIVSPFGKTDTASVLLEAIGYIRFLQTQIEALSLPYLQDSGSPNIRNRQHSAKAKRRLSRKLKAIGGSEPVDHEVEAEIARDVIQKLRPRGVTGHGAGVKKSQVTKFGIEYSRMRGEAISSEKRFLVEKVDSQSKKIKAQSEQIELLSKKNEAQSKQIESQSVQLNDMEEKMKLFMGELQLFKTAFPDIYIVNLTLSLVLQMETISKVI